MCYAGVMLRMSLDSHAEEGITGPALSFRSEKRPASDRHSDERSDEESLHARCAITAVPVMSALCFHIHANHFSRNSHGMILMQFAGCRP
jgi:hypothetical protein